MRDELDALRRDIAAADRSARRGRRVAALGGDIAALAALRDEVARVAAMRDDIAALGALRTTSPRWARCAGRRRAGSLRDDVAGLASLRRSSASWPSCATTWAGCAPS